MDVNVHEGVLHGHRHGRPQRAQGTSPGVGTCRISSAEAPGAVAVARRPVGSDGRHGDDLPPRAAGLPRAEPLVLRAPGGELVSRHAGRDDLQRRRQGLAADGPEGHGAARIRRRRNLTLGPAGVARAETLVLQAEGCELGQVDHLRDEIQGWRQLLFAGDKPGDPGSAATRERTRCLACCWRAHAREGRRGGRGATARACGS
mmetsp:Transcript_12489/g.35764  ORF Transcript_12489/g.35764 Transcript_12489/m.35764 type:complete len:203 (+) Transcript_12489:544-1152(+)